MKTGRKRFITGTPLITLTACIIFAAHPATAAPLSEEEQGAAAQRATAEIKGDMRNNIIITMRETIKKNTAARKRASVVKTCMECRSGRPLRVKITGRTAILDLDTQTIINRNMAAMIEKTMREKSSDPAVARSVQKKMMDERMAENILQPKMQPYMTGIIFDSARRDIAAKKYMPDTPLLTMLKN